MAAMSAVAEMAGTHDRSGEELEGEETEPIRRDKQAMHHYYSAWDQFDVDGELEKLDESAMEQQRREREQRQAAKDKILDEMAVRPDGDRTRTSKARPRVKVAVRASGRRVAPVDLAEPKRKEANGYFSAGRFREAVAMYSAALDLLEKYEPPSSQEAGDVQRPQEGGVDGAGDETEAMQLKTTLLANRAAAMLKLEEWRHVIDDCSEALRFDPKHCKAMLRRGFAYARLKVWAKAARDLEQAVVAEPGDKKAKAELQMARRMLQEQTKEARDRARRVMLDPTRQQSMPTRRLTVRVQRTPLAGGAGYGAEPSAASAPAAPPKSGLDDLDDATGPSASSTAPAPAAERRPYVPRAVRMRGRQPSAAQAALDAPAASAAPQMNFYTFESLWARHRGRAAERLALLRRAGARALPALFRESLDSELVASISEVLAETLPEGEAAFAVEVLAALARTPRFDVSCQGLTRQERGVCRGLLGALAERGVAVGDDVVAAYEEPPSAAAGEDSDEPPEEETAEAPASSRTADTDIAEPVAEAQVVSAPAFSLDGCD